MTHMNFVKQFSPDYTEFIRVTLETGYVEHDIKTGNSIYAENCMAYDYEINRLPKFIEALQREGFRFFIPEPKQ